MLVPDASALIAALTVDTDYGERVRSALVAGGQLHAPYVVDLEVLSGIRGLLAGGKLSSRRADQARDDYWDLAITRHPHRALAERVWELRHNLTVYDAAYVALAELVGSAVLTLDDAMATAPGIDCVVELMPKD